MSSAGAQMLRGAAVIDFQRGNTLQIALFSPNSTRTNKPPAVLTFKEVSLEGAGER